MSSIKLGDRVSHSDGPIRVMRARYEYDLRSSPTRMAVLEQCERYAASRGRVLSVDLRGSNMTPVVSVRWDDGSVSHCFADLVSVVSDDDGTGAGLF